MLDKKEKITFSKLKKKVLTYNKNKKEMQLIEKSYQFALKKHFGTKRLTNEDYITHPLNVAYILTNILADTATLCAALLHDVMEDCGVTKEELEKEFGLEIAFLVEGVTKINKLSFSGDIESMSANHRKIIVGLSEDVRVIILKLADRLHNMRTLWVLPEEKQKEKAKETLEILIPIAHRLGINLIKSELEDLALRYLKPDVYFSIVETLNQKRSERDRLVKEMVEKVNILLTEHGIKNEVKGRAKSIYSIYKKLDTGRKFSDIYDLLALRIFVETEQECYQALGIIHSKYRPIPKRFKDYLAMPKTNMYQSLHTTVFSMDGNLFEIQIRTYEMDKIAEHGIASHWSYKEKGSKQAMQSEMEQKLQFFRSIIELNTIGSNDQEFVDSVKEDIFKNTIYVFTPNGDVIELPKGSTPIDFAYRVHSEIGNKMVGAIVNGSIVPLDYKLQDDDIIQINTNNNSTGPSLEWLNLVKTVQAKNKIRSFYNKSLKEENYKQGYDLVSKALRKRKISLNDFFTNENIKKILKELKYKSIDEVYINIGSNKLAINQLLNIVFSETETKEELILKKVQTKDFEKPVIKTDIIVQGIDEIKVNIASCCKPVPGDKIVGYITKGRGITVHRIMCPNVRKIEDRIMEVNWNEKIEKQYPTSILVQAKDNKNLLLNIISKTSNAPITVQNINAMSKNNDFLYEIIVLVNDLEILKKFINDVLTIPSVLKVERIIK